MLIHPLSVTNHIQMGPSPYRQCRHTTHIQHSAKTNYVATALKFCTVIIFVNVDVQTTRALFINKKCALYINNYKYDHSAYFSHFNAIFYTTWYVP